MLRTALSVLASAALATLIGLNGCDKAPETGAAGSKGGSISIAFIPKGTTHSYWKAVQAGMEQAAKEEGLDVNWKGPLKENDRADQIKLVDQFVADGVKGMIISPLDNAALVQPIKSAMDAKIPVLIVDSSLNGSAPGDFLGFVGTNNRAAGEMAGEEVVKLMGGKGKFVLMRYLEGSASTVEREEGCLAVLAKHPEIQVLSSNRYGGPTIEANKTTAMNLIDQIKQADCVFAPNEPSVQGMMLALRQAGLAGKTKFVGFDASEALIDGLKKGDIHTLIVQDPRGMGYQSTKQMAAYLKNQTPVPANTDTGVKVVTQEGLNDPAIKKLVGIE
ncbi:MAG TPA: substrate-binding domain-containing protein [Tepidisphaeraceae bacterium]|jgi:ribose transport system substrate-binding protein